MHVTLVQVNVKPENIDAFIEACGENHSLSIQEPGNLRFDVLQDPEDATRFMLYEAYTSADTAAAHKETEHYLRWRETVADMMAEPRQGKPMKGLFPMIA